MFVHAGGHIGTITAAVLRNSPGVDVVAIEAIPEKAERLRRKFPSVTVLSLGLAEQKGRATFNLDMDDTPGAVWLKTTGGCARSSRNSQA